MTPRSRGAENCDNGKLDEEIYMEQPEGFHKPGTELKVFRLKRALYGLKQEGLAWWRTLSVLRLLSSEEEEPRVRQAGALTLCEQ